MNVERDRIVMRLYEHQEGFTLSQIARVTKLTRSCVAGIIHRNRTTPPCPIRAAARKRQA